VPYRLTVAMPHSPQVLAINPLGKVPAMRCGAFQLFESLAIASHIDRAYPARSSSAAMPPRAALPLARPHTFPAIAMQ